MGSTFGPQFGEMILRTSLFFLLFVTLFGVAEGKIRFLTFHYNRPDFIEYQKRCFDKYLEERDEYELIVFNDAPTEEISKKIESECARLDVECVRFDQAWHNSQSSTVEQIKHWESDSSFDRSIPYNADFAELREKHPSVRHCNVIQYALDHYGYEHNDIVGLLDGDMFLVSSMSVRKEMGDFRILGTGKRAAEGECYFWVALCLIDFPNLPDRHTLKMGIANLNGEISDSGGASFHYLKRHARLPVKKLPKISIGINTTMNHKSSKKLGVPLEVMELVNSRYFTGELHLNCHFLHYLRSSFQNGDGVEVCTHSAISKKNDVFKSAMEKII